MHTKNSPWTSWKKKQQLYQRKNITRCDATIEGKMLIQDTYLWNLGTIKTSDGRYMTDTKSRIDQ